jgi:pimaricinolide synthase PimS1
VDNAVAVIGLSCRLPGAPGPDAFWRLLSDGADAITEVPPGRWDVDTLGLTAPDRANIRRGGFIENVDRFDFEFFRMSPREAADADPQQRLVLELGWEALEDARVPPDQVLGCPAGVFIGAMHDDYAELPRNGEMERFTQHTMTGRNRGMIANRVSYFLGLRGPSLTVDSGQSSSLVAVHLAAESLQQGDCELAIAGGVNLNLIPQTAVSASRFGGLSPDGRCYAFDARANGFVRGEGGGVVVLKPLRRAVTDGDRIYCVIRGSAVNNDGGGESLTVPDQRAQEELIRRACDRAGARPRDVQYVELHGTGTKIGDPVEAAALGAVFGGARPAGSPLLVGSAKTNIGHLEGAAGMAGLIKVALCLRHGEIPPSLNFETPNPRIPLDALNLRVAQAAGAWPDPGQPMLAGVNSFGMGGTNCHVVVAGAPRPGDGDQGADPPGRRPAGTAVPWPLSARSAAGLRGQARRLREHVAGRAALAVADVGFSLATTRAALEHRAVVVASDREEFLLALAALEQGEPAANLVTGVTAEPVRVAYLFTGQGSQRPGMGRDLHASFPAYAAAFDEACAHLDRHLPRPLREVVFADADSADAALLDQTVFTQAGLFAVEAGLLRLLESWGLRADAVMGHSIGELVAAHAAGVLSLADACALVAARGRLMQALPRGGAMVSVQATEAEVARVVAEAGERVAVAAVNGPQQVVISGAQDAVLRLAGQWRAQGRKVRRLRVSHAFHSPDMDAMLPEFGRIAAGLSFARPAIPLVSNVTGQVASDGQVCEPGYWVRHARESVRFLDGIRSLAGQGVTTFVEVGPDGVLAAAGRGCLEPDRGDTAFVAVQRSDRPEVRALVTALARLHTRGVSPDWDAVFAGSGARRVDLPTYAFQRERCWPGPAAGRRDEVRAEAQPLASRLAGRPEAEQDRVLLAAVRTEAAAVLGYAPASAVDATRTFKDLGFNSLSAVELRDRLAAVTGLALPDTVVFDYPAPAALAAYLRAQFAGDRASDALSALHSELTRLEARLATIAAENGERDAVTSRLQALLDTWRGTERAQDVAAADDELKTATDDEMFALINKELGLA